MNNKTLIKRFVFIFIFACFCAVSPIQVSPIQPAPAYGAEAKGPFTDVPEGSWVYDAIARLASRGIISGYPDGLYKGNQTITRYEAASMTARAAAYSDRRKADVSDAETLDKLVFEFKDDIEALGLRLDPLDKDAAAFRERLGGWRMSGRIRMDVEQRNAENMGVSGGGHMGYAGLGDARFNLERWFGEKNDMYYHTRFRAESGGDDDPQTLEMYYSYVKIPFYPGSFITAGLAGAGSLDARFGYETPGMGRYSTWGWFDDDPLMMMRLDVNFVIFNFTAYAAHGTVGGAGDRAPGGELYAPHAWNFFTNFDIKLNQYLGFGLGAQYLVHDDWNVSSVAGHDKAWDDIFTAWFGADYNIFNVATAHGIIYYQSADTEDGFSGSDRPDGGTAWRLALDIGQDVLKFTSLYAEYMRAPSGFFAPSGIENNMLLSDSVYDEVSFYGNTAEHDISMWKIGANQRWNDKLSTWLFFADLNGDSSAGYSDSNAGLRQYGLGVEYAYGDGVTFGLNYLKWDGKDGFNDKNYSRVRFTTQVSF